MKLSEKAEKILDQFKQYTRNTKNALNLAGVPKSLIYYHMFFPPNFKDMIPEDVRQLYVEFRKEVILYLRSMGFSQREIARRLGGGSYHIVAAICQKLKVKSEFVTDEEVSKS